MCVWCGEPGYCMCIGVYVCFTAYIWLLRVLCVIQTIWQRDLCNMIYCIQPLHTTARLKFNLRLVFCRGGAIKDYLYSGVSLKYQLNQSNFTTLKNYSQRAANWKLCTICCKLRLIFILNYLNYKTLWKQDPNLLRGAQAYTLPSESMQSISFLSQQSGLLNLKYKQSSGTRAWQSMSLC